MENRKKWVVLCAVSCVCTFLVAVALTAGVGLTYLQATGRLSGSILPEATVQLQSAAPGASANPAATAQPAAKADYSRLDEIRSVIHKDALNDVADQKLIDGASEGMAIGSGDIYSEFFTKDQYKQFEQEEAGNYVGIGVSVNVDPKDSLVTVINVYKDSPADKGGMLPGDKIIKINGTDVTAKSLEEIVNLVRGNADTQLTMTVARGSDEKELTMTREPVTVNFTTGHMIDGTNGLGYIRILEFSGNAATLFDKTVKDLKAQGMKGFILDLRDNPGGSLDVVAPIADELFPAGPIITMIDRGGNVLDKINSNASALNIPMVVLVNGNTASASELLSGGIQDYKVGTLIGTTTYGKGVGQDFTTLSDGSVYKYTAFKYLTGGGRCPQSIGIQPDIVVELDKAVKANPLLLLSDQDNQYQAAITELQKLINK